MERRQFLSLGLTASGTALLSRTLGSAAAYAKEAKGAKAAKPAAAADKGPKITEKDILKEGQPATISNYCVNPDKQPNKFCPDWKAKPGTCAKCMFFNTDASETTFKGGKYAHCQLLNTQPQYVSEKAYCATYVEKT